MPCSRRDALRRLSWDGGMVFGLRKYNSKQGWCARVEKSVDVELLSEN